MLKPKVVLSVEQALTMTYATLRMVHLGYRVIRVEPTPVPGRKSKGDPNRYIGRPVAGEDRHSYFISPNLGKEAVSINLKEPEGQELLKQMVVSEPLMCLVQMNHEQIGFFQPVDEGVPTQFIHCVFLFPVR